MTTPSRAELFQKVVHAITEVKSIDGSDVKMTSTFDDLDVDSLAAVEVMFELEDDLGVALPDAAVREMQTVEDVVVSLEKFLSGETELTKEEKELAEGIGRPTTPPDSSD